jgi:hypothetical protein
VQGSDVQNTVYTSTPGGGDDFDAHVIAFPSVIPDDQVQDRLNAVANGIAQSVGGSIAHSAFLTVLNHPAIEFDIDAGPATRTKARVSLVGQKAYALVLRGSPRTILNAYDRFVNSFGLLA